MKCVPLSPRAQLNGAVPVQIAGEQRVLRFTMEALAACNTYAAELGVGQLLTLTWAMLLHEEPELDMETFSDRLDLADIAPLSHAVRQCLDLCTAPGKKTAGKATRADWARLWSFAEYDLRLSEDRFWSLTPRQFAALSDRFEEGYRRSLHGAALVGTALANIHRDTKRYPQALTTQQVYPGLFASPDPETEKKLAAARDVSAECRQIMTAIGARTVKIAPTKPKLRLRGNS